MYGVIYKATNKINEKMYIGQTINLKARKRRHLNSKETYVFNKAIKKYGKNNFKWEIIDSAETKDELDKKEIYWINELKTYIACKNSRGYNMTKGGSYVSDSTKKQIVQLTTDGDFIKVFESIEEASRILNIHATNIKDCCKGRYKMSGNFIFVYKSEYDENKEYKYKNSLAVPIVQLDLEGNFIQRYESICEAQRQINRSKSAIIECCQGKKKQAYGYLWIYENNYNPDNNKIIYSKRNTPTRTSPVVQFDLNLNFIKQYTTIEEAGKENNIKPQGISRVCRGLRKTSGGYKWMYYKDYKNSLSEKICS